MSSPFPIEEQAQQDQLEGRADPWSGDVRQSFGAEVLRSPYTVLEAFGSGAAKGQAVLAGAMHTPVSPDTAEMTAAGLSDEQIAGARKQADEMQRQGSDAFLADARARVKAMTLDPATAGTATQVLHSVAEGVYLLSTGSLTGGSVGAAATVGTVEGGSRYQDLKEQGVDTGTAATSAGVTALTAAAGAFVPAAYGSTLATRLLTGAASNTAFGTVNRAADHLILKAGGYDAMADQQEVWDGTQMLVDAALGATFGGIHHALTPHEQVAANAVRTPETRDAALAVNLSLKDRQSAPGVAVDPEAANAHQAALEKAQTDLLQGKPVDIADTGIDRAEFLSRPERDVTPEAAMVLRTFKESGLLDEEATLEALDAQFERRRSGEKEPAKPAASNFLNEFEAAHPENPEDATQRVMEGAKVELQRDPFDESALHINTLEADEAGKGAGSAALKEVTDLADKHGVRLTLDAKPFGEKGMEPDKLADFYKRFGFEVKEQGEGHALMERTPESPKVVPFKAKKPDQQALAERPNLTITEDGKPVKAADAIEAAKPEMDWFTATKAATDCFARRGG